MRDRNEALYLNAVKFPSFFTLSLRGVKFKVRDKNESVAAGEADRHV